MSEALKVSRKIMGGTFCVQVWTNQQEHYHQIIDDGFDQISELENKLTDFRASPFNQINELAGMKPAVVDQETYALIKIANEFSKKTNGAFDISYATVGLHWRAARANGQLPDEKLISELSKLINYKNIQMNKSDSSVYLPDQRMRIGLGGIGKGYAVDKLYQFLLQKGFTNFLIDGAGDVRVHSEEHAPRPWKLGIRNPFAQDDAKKIGFISLQSGALATSGDYVNFIKSAELKRKFHHVINPRNGFPTEEIVSSSVMAPTALEADLNATLLMILGPVQGLNYLNNSNLAGLMVKSDGNVLISASAMKMMGAMVK